MVSSWIPSIFLVIIDLCKDNHIKMCHINFCLAIQGEFIWYDTFLTCGHFKDNNKESHKKTLLSGPTTEREREGVGG